MIKGRSILPYLLYTNQLNKQFYYQLQYVETSGAGKEWESGKALGSFPLLFHCNCCDSDSNCKISGKVGNTFYINPIVYISSFLLFLYLYFFIAQIV